MSLSTRQLCLSRGERQLLHDINLQLQSGDALRVAGQNGSGKTSFMRILAGLSQPESGSVHWQEQDIQQLREQYFVHLLYLGHAQGVKDDLLAWENLVFSCRLQGQRISEQQACEVLEQLGLGPCAWLPIRALSQGQRKRVALARLHLAPPAGMPARLWLLDEAFTALDVAAVAQLIACINRHLQAGGMLVYTTHQDVQLQAGRNLLLDLSTLPQLVQSASPDPQQSHSQNQQVPT